jgi:hypothetical protein
MTRETVIRHLVDTLDIYLARFDGPGIADVRAGIAEHRGGPLQPVTPNRVPATRHAETALDAMQVDGESALAEAIAAAMPFLEWGAYDPYPRAEIGEKYAENHAAASIIGSGGHLLSRDFDLGLFVFGPETLYRDHHHAAPELYAPFTGPNGWRFASGQPLEWRSAHRPVWNEAWAPHAIKSGSLPFFCVYGWTRDVAVPARMIVEPDWAELEAVPGPRASF